MRNLSRTSPLLLLAACAAPPGGDDGETAAASTAVVSTGTTGGATGSSGAALPTTTGAPALPGACEVPIEPVPKTSAHLQVDAGGRLRDEQGRDVQLRGLNTGGRSKFPPFLPFAVDPEAELPAVRDAADVYFGRMPGWGLDVVRLSFSWEALEPTPGSYDARYLDRYATLVDAAWAQGLRVIVEFHQDIYASPFCGDGFPPWTLPGEPGPPHYDCKDWGLKYVLDPDVRGAFDRFWADEGDIHARFYAMWGQMIDRVGDHPGVFGLEILNEPGWGTAGDIGEWKVEQLNPFHTAAVAELRARAGDELLIFFNNPGFDALGYGEITHVRPEGEGLVYAPHLYDPSLIMGQPWSGSEPEPVLDSFADFAAAEGLPVLIGEFGYGHGAPEGDVWLRRALDHIDARRLSATLWEYSESAELWNFEDLSVIEPDGGEREILDTFVRPYLRALAGEQPELAWDGAAVTARFTADGGVTELALPPRIFFADGAVPEDISIETLSGEPGACFTVDAARGELRVQAPAGARVEVRVAR